MNQVYAPGCELLIYKPEFAAKILEMLNKDFGDIPEHLICCRHNPGLESGTQIISTCSGCDRRYRELYDGLYIGGKKPRYILDPLFGEETEIGIFEPDAWHAELQKFIEKH